MLRGEHGADVAREAGIGDRAVGIERRDRGSGRADSRFAEFLCPSLIREIAPCGFGGWAGRLGCQEVSGQFQDRGRFKVQKLHAGNLPPLSFDADKATMRWPPLQGVPSYVMYRGDLSSLVDAEQDGLPDFGYGDCVSGSAPNPTDGAFVDSELPAEAGGSST